jgi:hypothetical protein
MKPPDEPERPLSPGILNAGGVIESRVRSHQVRHIFPGFRLVHDSVLKMGRYIASSSASFRSPASNLANIVYPSPFSFLYMTLV